jgi:hypothetical protein
MHRAHCPYCNNVNVIADADWGRLVHCEAPGCGRPFMAGEPQGDRIAPAPTLVSPTPSNPVPLPDKPLLTGPHVCHACRGEIRQALGRRRGTIVHRLPARNDQPAGDPCRMDIYAAIYHCPNPHCRALLETPSYQWGQSVTCPDCAMEFEAPRDDILHERAGDACEGQPFSFACPSCHVTLRSDSTRQGKPMRGHRVVCLSCQQIIEVPAAGKAVGGHQHVADSREVMQSGTRRCVHPECGQMIPARAVVCPLCRQPQGDQEPAS